MGLLTLGIYAPATLQAMAALLRSSQEEQITASELLVIIEQHLQVPQQAGTQRVEVCPSCGRAPLSPVLNADGLRIVGCRLCRYSQVI